MSTLFLLRHGETIANLNQIYQGQGDDILSKTGIAQAKFISKNLSNINFSAFYSSDLTRAFETAKFIAKPHNMPVTKIPELKERNYGCWEGLCAAEVAKKYSRVYKTWLKNPNNAKIPYAETLLELQKRGVKAIQKIIKRHKDENVLVVGHGGINRVILSCFLGLDLNYFWRLMQNNCGINIINFKELYPKVKLINGRCVIDEQRLDNPLD